METNYLFIIPVYFIPLFISALLLLMIVKLAVEMYADYLAYAKKKCTCEKVVEVAQPIPEPVKPQIIVQKPREYETELKLLRHNLKRVLNDQTTTDTTKVKELTQIIQYD